MKEPKFENPELILKKYSEDAEIMKKRYEEDPEYRKLIADGLVFFDENRKINFEDIKSLLQFHYSDVGNAGLFAMLSKGDFKYCAPTHKWLCWRGTHWKVDDIKTVFRHAKRCISRYWLAAMYEPDTEKKKAHFAHALRSENSQRIKGMCEMAQSESTIPILPEELDKDPMLLNVLNGTYNLDTMEFHPNHYRSDYITKLADVEYDPDAKCPKWEEFLKKVTGGNKALQDYLQMVIAYVFTGKVGEHKLFFLYGKGRNGKTTFLLTILKILHNYAIKCAPEMLMKKGPGAHTTDITDLKGVRLAVTIEVQQGRQWSESLVKELTGGDIIRARRMRQDNTQWEPTHKIILAANHKPATGDSTTAFWRRMALIPFTVEIPEKEVKKDYHEILLEERNGILNWVIEGYKKYKEQGLNEPKEVINATKAYRGEEDILGLFIDECVVIEQGLECLCSEVRTVYKAWCKINSEKELGAKAFNKILEEKGCYRKRWTTGNRPYNWHNIELKVTPRQDNDKNWHLD